MVNTRTAPSSSQSPPPPPPTLAEIVAQQAQLINLLAQGQLNNQQGHVPRGPNRESSYADFESTRPPIFTTAADPLKANNWIRTMESKFSLIHCSDQQKAQYAAQMLQGPTGAWYATFLAMQPAGHQIPWPELRQAFRAHYIPASLMKLKLREFLALKQGGKSVMEYMHTFNHLAQYASTHIDLDEKKRECFLEGLNSKLKLHLGNRFASLHELVDDALTMEDHLRVAREEEKNKRQISAPTSGSSQRPRLIYQRSQHFVS